MTEEQQPSESPGAERRTELIASVRTQLPEASYLCLIDMRTGTATAHSDRAVDEAGVVSRSTEILSVIQKAMKAMQLSDERPTEIWSSNGQHHVVLRLIEREAFLLLVLMESSTNLALARRVLAAYA